MLLKERIFLLVSLLYILYTVVPIVQDVTGIDVWIINLATFFILFVLFPSAYLNPVMYWFLAYAYILAIYVLLEKPLTIGIGSVQDSKKIIIEYAFFLPSLSIFSILYYLDNKRLYKIISVAALALLLLSFIYMLPLILSNSNIIRQSVSAGNEEHRILGMPSYTLIHAYVILVPAVLYGFRIFKAGHKWGMLVVVALFVYIILNTHVTTSLVLVLAMIIFVLLFDIQNKKKSFIFVFFTFLIVYILHVSGVFIHLFDFLIRFFDGTDVQPKIKSFKYIYLYGDIENSGGSVIGRMNLHDMSWKAFWENPLIGGSSAVGGHSSLIDRLGGMGLLAFIPFIMITITQVKITLRLIRNKEARVYYFLGLLAVFTMLYQKGLFGQVGWLFMMVLMPGLIITFQNSQTTKK
jgi:hypothetical protein